MILSRNLFKTEISQRDFDPEKVKKQKNEIVKKLGISESDLSYFAITEKLINSAYDEKDKQILILSKNGATQDIAQASDNLNILALTKPVEKFCFCYARISWVLTKIGVFIKRFVENFVIYHKHGAFLY